MDQKIKNGLKLLARWKKITKDFIIKKLMNCYKLKELTLGNKKVPNS